MKYRPLGPTTAGTTWRLSSFARASSSASRHWRRLISTSRKPTVICVGRRLVRGTPIGIGSDILFLTSGEAVDVNRFNVCASLRRPWQSPPLRDIAANDRLLAGTIRGEGAD